MPAADAVVFTRPKTSEADVVQAARRVLRRNRDGSGIATVLIPLRLLEDPHSTLDDTGEWATM